jgi:ketosteroid isomerase-like protein
MKHVILLLLIFNSGCVLAQNQANEKMMVQKVIQEFFVAFHQKDTLQLKKYCHDKITLSTIIETPQSTEWKEEMASNFFKSIASIPNTVIFEEKIHDMQISIDGNMAHVWATYSFFVQKKLSHSGVNSIHLIKQDGHWKIITILDTRRK